MRKRGGNGGHPDSRKERPNEESQPFEDLAVADSPTNTYCDAHAHAHYARGDQKQLGDAERFLPELQTLLGTLGD